MSFGFQFEDDELDDEYKGLQDKSERSHGQTSTAESSSSARNEAQAKKHTLKEFIATLPNRISYSSIIVPLQDSQTTTLFRRDLFDARFQLINDYDHDGEEEDNGNDTNEKTGKKVDLESYSVGTDTDLIPGVYEGGFKTWECSLDLVTYLQDRIGEEKESSSWLEERRITEIGCGTAMPSMYLFSLMLQDREQGKKVGSKLELCDFNEQVLRLLTFPNMLLTWYFNSSEDRKGESNGEVELTEEIVEEFVAALKDLDITLDFYSGPWETLHRVGAFEHPATKGNIVLTSETIYAMASLPSLVETLDRACKSSIVADLQHTTLLESEEDTEPWQAICLVAAKVLYFGVGGGVNSFKEELTQKNGTSKTVWNSDRGVARVVLQIGFPRTKNTKGEPNKED